MFAIERVLFVSVCYRTCSLTACRLPRLLVFAIERVLLQFAIERVLLQPADYLACRRSAALSCAPFFVCVRVGTFEQHAAARAKFNGQVYTARANAATSACDHDAGRGCVFFCGDMYVSDVMGT